jgi:TPR repeat protein
LAAESSTFQHALLLLRTGDMDGARQWLQIAANGGHIRAMTLLGLYYAELGDQQSAVRWLTAAAESGEQSAMNFLGVLYDGQGDLAAAVHWWGQSAQLGDPVAMYSLGELLIRAGYVRDGEGWVRAAAEAGHGRALSHLDELASRPTRSEQHPEPAAGPRRETAYGGPAGGRRQPGFERGYGYQASQQDDGWRGGYPTQLAALGEAASGLVARSGRAAGPELTGPGQAGTGHVPGAGYLDPGFGTLR